MNGRKMHFKAVRDTTGEQTQDSSLHWYCWLGGIICVLIPYGVSYFFPKFTAPWILPAGHLADNSIILVRNVVLGMLFGGGLGLLLSSPSSKKNLNWWSRSQSLNWLWLGLTLLLYLLHNFLILKTLPAQSGELVSISINRVLVVLFFVFGVWLFTEVAAAVSPHKVRWLPWLIPIGLPAILALDTMVLALWRTPLRQIINRFDTGGGLNLSRELAAAGITLPPIAFIGLIVLCLLLLCLLFYVSLKFSRKLPLCASPKGFTLICAVSLLVINLEAFAGRYWKSLGVRQAAYNRFYQRFSPATPPIGVAKFSVNFRPAQKLDLTPPPHARTPDIFFIIIESVRSDALNEQTAPFLLKEFAPDCQPLGTTWAGSNATQLSWYTIFHGDYTFRWNGANDSFLQQGIVPVSPWFRALHALNYQCEVRAVCDLSYAGMGTYNFGIPHKLHALQQVNSKTPDSFKKLSIAEREVKNFENARKNILENSANKSPLFQLIALDSPHYPYLWHKDFTPPFSDFDDPPQFPLNPSQNEVKKVKNRYLNAIAWADHQVEEFINFLKKQNRYDDALIIVTGDHGEEFQERGSWFHASSLEPEQTAVPIFLKWPKGHPAPAHRSASHLDLLPSLLSYLGYSEEMIADLPGNNLLRASPEESTKLLITPYCGLTGSPMVWHREGYTAHFHWSKPWELREPGEIHIGKIQGPAGDLSLSKPKEWAAALQAHFPDAIERFFTNFHVYSKN